MDAGDIKAGQQPMSTQFEFHNDGNGGSIRIEGWISNMEDARCFVRLCEAWFNEGPKTAVERADISMAKQLQKSIERNSMLVDRIKNALACDAEQQMRAYLAEVLK